ncbi:MAG: glutamine--fructose-6-phosphate transaminase (isomerizing) [Candidatus Aminicenantes bacterium]|nr:glutamine--fructose-6-phosphate transaminase (isomerizing) [Candidatus Aminicenantes bacterium]
MCGIVGIVSEKAFSSRTLLERLKRLEYRGYDSYGVFDGREVRKRIGGIRVEGRGRSTAGIAHTRWATHGGVSERNAHPHLSCDGRIAIVHNGIIENYEEIKKDLVRKGHSFASETDSEVIAHLLEDLLRRRSIEEALPALIRALAGTFAVLIMIKGRDKIYAIKRDSPLVLGTADGRTILASDIYAFSDWTNRAAFFDNDEIAVVGPDGHRFFDRNGKRIRKPLRTFRWEEERTGKRRAKHYMLKEILEEPSVVRRLLFSLGHDQKPAFHKLLRLIRRSRKVIFASCGTSYHATLLGAYYLHQVGMEVQTLIASEFRHFAKVDRDTLIVAVSQSGETMDVIDALKYAQANGGRIVSIVNVPHSTIQRMSELSLNILAGPEICVASTKAFVNQAALLLKLAQAFGFKVNCDNLPDRIQTLFKARAKIKAIAERIARSKDAYIIGRGLTYPIAREIALKIKETSYIHAEGMMGGELKHGTIALIESGTPVVSLINNNDADIISNTKEVEARGAKIFILTNHPTLGGSEDTVHIKTGNDGKFGILAAVAGQLIAYYAADALGRPIDKPRNLAKSVTVK